MKPNVGTLDRTLRILAGLVPLLTATFRFCPAYLAIGLSPCSRPKGKT